ncbi:MAG: tol-pal system protein YbgF [Hyphomicrobiaceae bacterium]|jgi:tol-pal system protein YbgF
MRYTNRTVSSLLGLCLLATAGCGTQYDRQRSPAAANDDFRNLVVEQRRAIEDLQREQESLRAAVEELQYRGGGRATGAAAVADPGVYTFGGPAPSDPTVPYSAPQAGVGEFSGTVGYGDTTGQSATAAPEATDVPRTASVASVPAPAASPSPRPRKGPVPSVPDELTGTGYERGVRGLVGGSYDESIQTLRTFIHENPTSRHSDDAQYWIGEAYFRKAQYHRAIIEFQQVANSYGTGDRAAAALVRQAEAFRLVGDRVDARLSLQKVINRYPGTEEAASASRMLGELGG